MIIKMIKISKKECMFNQKINMMMDLKSNCKIKWEKSCQNKFNCSLGIKISN